MINYTLHTTGEALVVVVPNDFDRAMLFCRVQEYYESPNEEFSNKDFSVWDYFKWHRKEYGEEYWDIWEGFNVPYDSAVESSGIIETEYDKEFCKILRDCKSKYIIGVDSIGSKTYVHEMAHVLFATDEAYRKEVVRLIEGFSGKHGLYKELLEWGYAHDKLDDEMQAYLVSGEFGDGEQFQEVYGRYVKVDDNKIKVQPEYNDMWGILGNMLGLPKVEDKRFDVDRRIKANDFYNNPRNGDIFEDESGVIYCYKEGYLFHKYRKPIKWEDNVFRQHNHRGQAMFV